jgi:hypothetical protein
MDNLFGRLAWNGKDATRAEVEAAEDWNGGVEEAAIGKDGVGATLGDEAAVVEFDWKRENTDCT